MIGVVSNLDEKLLYDFHGNAPIIDDTFKGQLPKITNKASIFIAEQLQPGQYFKFGVDGGGCSGFQYAFEVIDEPLETDIKFSESPLAVTDRESMPYLHGSTIDLEDSGFNKMLKVDNPGAKMSCGCGTSFNYDTDYIESMLEQFNLAGNNERL